MFFKCLVALTRYFSRGCHPRIGVVGNAFENYKDRGGVILRGYLAMFFKCLVASTRYFSRGCHPRIGVVGNAFENYKDGRGVFHGGYLAIFFKRLVASKRYFSRGCHPRIGVVGNAFENYKDGGGLFHRCYLAMFFKCLIALNRYFLRGRCPCRGQEKGILCLIVIPLKIIRIEVVFFMGAIWRCFSNASWHRNDTFRGAAATGEWVEKKALCVSDDEEL